MIMAVGAYNGNPNGITDAGYLRLYEKFGSDWNSFQQINGNEVADRFGYSLDLSHDGSILTFTSYLAVHIYELSSSASLYTWLDTKNYNACEVAVSPDGSAVGVTSLTSNEARIFERFGVGFQQRGIDITGYGFSSGIALNYNGTIVIVGDYFWDSKRGRAAVYQWKDNIDNGSMDWIKMGLDMTGDASGNSLGYAGSLSITHEGLTVAVGAPFYDEGGYRKGLVRVNNYDATEGTWIKSERDLIGNSSYDQLFAITLSSDGTYLAAGTWGGHYVKIFKKDESKYETIGDITSEGGEYFGYTIDMSADGSTVAIGAYAYDTNKGKVYLFEGIGLTETPSVVPTSHPSSIPSANSPLAETDFAITFINEETITDFTGESPDSEFTMKTLITDNAPRESFKQSILDH